MRKVMGGSGGTCPRLVLVLVLGLVLITVLSPVESLLSQGGDKVIKKLIIVDSKGYEPGRRVANEKMTEFLSKEKAALNLTRFKINKTDDPKDLISISLKQLNLKLNNTDEESHSTYLYPMFSFTENAEFVPMWEGNYCVQAELTTDYTETLDNNTKVTYITCFTFNKTALHVNETDSNLMDHIMNNANLTSVDYKTFGGQEDVVHISGNGNECGSKCVAVISITSFVLIVAIISMIFTAWRRRSGKKRKSAQGQLGEASDVEMHNGYGDRGGRILLSDTEYPNSFINGRTSEFFPNPALIYPDNFFQVESKWEIPREDLHLEHVLGEGEFGRVLKGILKIPNGHQHVAVKMLKVDETEGNKFVRQEFMVEFSLLKQLDHTNVIKLLGACTSNRGGPPLLVMEYAELGSLRSFLRKCRRIEKISLAHELDWADRQSGNFRHSEDISTMAEYFVTPREVLGFSWQIAKGMAYLSDMKMVHRDLAARNVLLTKTKVCKISDFGLTRDIYVDDTYKKKSKDRVPVKWLAPECLTDELYTLKSDVWAFGVLLWELTTLGASPYPGIQTESLYALLDSGYRMQQPRNCSNEVYSIMRKCWEKVPSERPTFHQLVLELSRLVENGIEYLKLDLPTVSNPGYDILGHNEPPLETMIVPVAGT